MKEKITYFGESITGRRLNNEDSFLCEQIADETWLFIVADGMGGSEHGEVASKLAVDTFFAHIKESITKETSETRLKTILETGFHKAQNAIKEEVENDSRHSGMGTTLVVLLIHNNSCVWGNIGDSRIYKIDSTGIRQITRDHTYIEDVLKEKGEKNVSQDFLSQHAHIITRSVSGGNDKPDLFPEGQDFLSLNSVKLFLLCSDGLISEKSNQVNENDFYQNFQENQDVSSYAKTLVKNAFDNGSTDNITAVCISLLKQ